MKSLHPAAKNALLLAFVLATLGLPRGLALDRFVTVDEPRWLMRSANFYRALAHGDLKGTFQREHPGVTITWAGTAGFLWAFPGYFKIAPGSLSELPIFHQILRRYEKSPLTLLAAGRTFVVLAIVLILGLAFMYTARLLGHLQALFAFLIIAFDPFAIAFSRLLHLDGLLSALMLLSLLAFIAYLYHGRRSFDLILSGVAAGLAWLTKSPAFFLAPFVGLILLVEGLKVGSRLNVGLSPAGTSPAARQEAGDRSSSLEVDSRAHESGRVSIANLRGIVIPWLIWFGVAAGVFVLLWPAMWVDPLGSLGRVFSTALAYAEEGHARGNFFNGMIFAEGDLPWYFYLIAYAWRTTPIVMLGLILAFLALIFRRRLNLPPEILSLVPVLALFAALFTIFMSLGAKKFDRYLLPIFMPLDLVAGVGWLAFLYALHRWLIQYRPAVWMRLSSIVLPGALVLIQLLGVLHTFPYYLNYYNPWLGGDRVADNVMMVGWGEGLDQAARYLNSIPVAKGVRVLSWYGEGCLSYFYEGVSDTFGDDYAYTNLRSDDFVVLYLNQWQRRLPSKNFLSIFERFPAEYIVRLGNLEYARVYDMSKAPAGVLP